MSPDDKERSGDDREDGMPSPGEQQVLDALQRMARPAASAQARQQARDAFVHGAVPLQRRSVVDAGTVQRIRRWPVVAAIAAVLAFVVVGWGMLPDDRWVVTSIAAPAGVRFADGQGGTLQVGSVLGNGQLETAAESEVEIMLGSDLRLRLMPGTRIQLPREPGRWFWRRRTLYVHAGEAFGTTGPQPPPLQLATDEAIARFTGTTFAVFRNDDGTCVCLLEGGIQVSPRDQQPPVQVPSGQKFYVYTDSRPTELVPIDSMERMKLNMIRDAGVELPSQE